MGKETKFEDVDWQKLQDENPDADLRYTQFRVALREGKLDKMKPIEIKEKET